MNILRKKICPNNVPASKNSFSILTYNILADCHVLTSRFEDYHYVNDEYLLKDDDIKSKRHQLMMKELEHFKTDMIFLQEVEDGYSPILESEVQKLGYEYVFFQKAGVAEGLASCYKKDKFECLGTIKFLIHDEVIKLCEKEGVSEIAMNQMAEPTVSLITTLKDTTTGKVIICANTDINYDEFAEPAIQCLQVSLTCKQIDEVRKEKATKLGINENDISVIFAGAFNGEPDHMCIQLMKNGKLIDSQMKTLETLTYNMNERKPVPMEFYEICHVSKYLARYLENPLKLSSAYFEAKGVEPAFTSSKGTCIGCLDYIFYSGDLQVASVVDIDSSVTEAFNEGGPTEQFASDHLPLSAQFVY